jgi:hypothetical protein
MKELEYKRDRQYPFTLQLLNRLEVTLSVYSERSEENPRKAKDELFGIQNSRKAREGGLAGLLDPAIMQKKAAEEAAFRKLVANDPKWKETAKAWDVIAGAQDVISKHAMDYNLFERGLGFNSKYFGIAKTIVRAAAERNKPNGERLREFRESARESLELELFSEEPIYDDFEKVKLGHSLTWLAGVLGYENPMLQKILAGKSPQERASELIDGTKVKEVAARKELYGKEPGDFASLNDPMIQLVLLVDETGRNVRKILEEQEEVKRQAHGQIAQARFALQGASTYPDATFTLRLAFGQVRGYEEAGKQIPFQTTFSGLYEHAAEHNNKPPFDLPPLWEKRKSNVPMDAPINFVSTADIIGGNSGSPVLNQNAELVGIIFDGNIYSLVLDFVYTDIKARAVSVHSQGIIEALRHVYEANDVADELQGKKR